MRNQGGLLEGDGAEIRAAGGVQAGAGENRPYRDNHTYKGPQWTKVKLKGPHIPGWAGKEGLGRLVASRCVCRPAHSHLHVLTILRGL